MNAQNKKFPLKKNTLITRKCAYQPQNQGTFFYIGSYLPGVPNLMIYQGLSQTHS